MKFVAFSGIFFILIWQTENSSVKKDVPEKEKERLDKAMKFLANNFKKIEKLNSKVEELTEKLKEIKEEYESKLYPTSMRQFSYSFDDQKMYSSQSFMASFKFNKMAHEIGMFKVDVEELHSQIQQAQTRMSVLCEKTQSNKAAYEIMELKDLAKEEDEEDVFSLLRDYYIERLKCYTIILESYEEMNQQLYYAILPMTMISESAVLYPNLMEAMKDYGKFAENWEYVKETVDDLISGDFSYSLNQEALQSDYLLNIPVKKDKRLRESEDD